MRYRWFNSAQRYLLNSVRDAIPDLLTFIAVSTAAFLLGLLLTTLAFIFY